MNIGTPYEQIHAKPETVQIVLKAKMTKDALDVLDPTPNWENYAPVALAWWDNVISQIRLLFRADGLDDAEVDEIKVACHLVAGMRDQEV